MTAAARPPPFKAGDRVRRSREALRPLLEERSRYLSGPIRDRAEHWLAEREAKRGTVTECSPGPHGYGWGVSVQWDDGTRSSCLDYMVTLDKDGTS